jgi:hypothetical protein
MFPSEPGRQNLLMTVASLFPPSFELPQAVSEKGKSAKEMIAIFFMSFPKTFCWQTISSENSKSLGFIAKPNARLSEAILGKVLEQDFSGRGFLSLPDAAIA